jgi:TatD DNase family protein
VLDTHCHLTFPDFQGRIDAELAEAGAAGVTGAITISTTTDDCLEALALARAHGNLWCTSGVHPLHSHEGPHAWAKLRTVALDPRCVAWGELGLDNHYDEPARDVQHTVLDEQLAFIESCRTDAARPIDLPVVLHCREAFDDLLPILRRTRLDPARFVFHCFTGTPADVRKCLDFGAMISFTGVVTYRNAADVREAATLVPLDRIMVETDAPYLSPEPYRGKRPCRPAWVRHTAEALASLRGEPFDAFHRAINRNTERFFGIADVQ